MSHPTVALMLLSPVLSKRAIVLLHGLDLWVLVSIFFLFHCGLSTSYVFIFINIIIIIFKTHCDYMHATWILAALVPLDETHYEQD